MLTATSDRSPVPPVPTKLPAALRGGAGLTKAEAAARRATFGPNEVESGRRFEAARTLLRFLSSPLVLILLAASIVSGFLGEPLNVALIALMVMLSVVLDFVQVYRSERAAEKLQRLVALTATVWRDGQQTEVPVRDVVPGDLLDLHAGDLVVADATQQAAAFLTLDEASLTGESIPVEKRGGGDGPQHRVFAGTSVVSGEARAVVTEKGSRTQFGAIAHALVQRAPVTEFEAGSRRFGYLIMRTVVGLMLFVFLVKRSRLATVAGTQAWRAAQGLAVDRDAVEPRCRGARRHAPAGAARLIPRWVLAFPMIVDAILPLRYEGGDLPARFWRWRLGRCTARSWCRWMGRSSQSAPSPMRSGWRETAAPVCF